jgi:hypothetical protein
MPNLSGIRPIARPSLASLRCTGQFADMAANSGALSMSSI